MGRGKKNNGGNAAVTPVGATGPSPPTGNARRRRVQYDDDGQIKLSGMQKLFREASEIRQFVMATTATVPPDAKGLFDALVKAETVYAEHVKKVEEENHLSDGEKEIVMERNKLNKLLQENLDALHAVRKNQNGEAGITFPKVAGGSQAFEDESDSDGD